MAKMKIFQLEFDNLKMLVMDEADQLLEDDNAKELRRLVKMPGWPNVLI